jgi:hypothetical protein
MRHCGLELVVGGVNGRLVRLTGVACPGTDRTNRSHGCVASPATSFASGFASEIRDIPARTRPVALHDEARGLGLRNTRRTCGTLKSPEPEDVIVIISTITKGDVSGKMLIDASTHGVWIL